MEQSAGRDLSSGPSKILQGASGRPVSCFWCERLHRGEHPLSVCPACMAGLSTMRLLEMSGSYPLSHDAIDQELMQVSPGNYALGYMMDRTTFVVSYVGRSDSDVRRCLHEWVGAPSPRDRYAHTKQVACASGGGDLLSLGAPALGGVGDSSYARFAYAYAPSAEVAFERECRNYDDFGGSGELDNEAHPTRMSRRAAEASGTAARPRCGTLDEGRRMNPQMSLSGLDAAFLSLETPSTPMNVVGTFVLDASRASGGYSYERILRMMEVRLPDLGPFRRRLVTMPFGLDFPIWIDDPDLRVRDHIHRVGAPAPGSEQVLAELVAQIAAQPLDRTRPLWELWVVEGLAEGRIALVFKLHHAVADGVSAAQLLLQLFDSSPQQADPVGSHEKVKFALPPTSRALLGHALSRLPRRSLRLARLLRDTARSLVAMGGARLGRIPGTPRMPVPFSAPRLRWNSATSPRRTVAFGTARLADVKLVNSVFGTTVNHVVLAACTQTLRSYLEAHGGAPKGPLVAAIPISMRTPEEVGTYGNRISAFFVHLPVHLADPIEQLLALREGAQSSRQRHATLRAGALGEWAEFTSSALLARAARFYSDWKLAGLHRPLHNLVISNVRGAGTPLYAAGARVTAAYPLGPLMEGAGMNITVVSYMDSVDFGIIACERSVPHAADIARGFGAAVAELVKVALDERSEPLSVGGSGATVAHNAASATGT